MKRSEFLRLGGVLPLAALSGCAWETAAEMPAKHKVTLIAKSTKTAFWKSAFAGAQTAATEYNTTLTVNGPETEENYAAQNDMVAQAVKDGAEAIVFSAIDFSENVAAIEAAADAGVKIVAIDSDVNTDKKAAYIGTDNYAAGQMAAQAALQSGLDEMRVGLVNYDINSANGQQREQGVRDTLANCKNVEIAAAINTIASAERSESDTAEMLRAHPEINVLIAFNEPTAVGAGRALRVMGTGSAIWLVGFDSNVEAVDMLQTGNVDALIVQNPYAMGYLGVESAVALLNGQEDEVEPIVDTSTVIVNRDNMFTTDSQKILVAFNE
jgi:ribose transport system substrate-binding protein